MFSICKSESTKSSCRLLDLEHLKLSIAERTMAKDTLALIQEIAPLLICDQLPKSAVILHTVRHSAFGREN